jgi:glycogen(starch) synthase
MKMVLIGPYPPPHGGISVNILGLYRQLTADGVACVVLDPHRYSSKIALVRTLIRYASDGWTLHLHANGHNRKSWLLAFLCGFVAGIFRTRRILTLHSGLVPRYLHAGFWQRRLAKIVCRLHNRIVCVNPAIRDAIVLLGIHPGRIEITPAYLAAASTDILLDSLLLAWLETHEPLISTALFFRPEYGFELLIECLERLRRRYPSLGCLVMGSGEHYQEAVAQIRDACLEDTVLLLGDVEHDRCLAIMARCDVFVRPTLEDGDSLSVREASSLGIPVVASRVGTRPDGVILFRPGDAEDMLSKVESALIRKLNPIPECLGAATRCCSLTEHICLNLK